MGFISEEDVEKVRAATDLVSLIAERTPVRQRGREFWCCCPLHNEKTPSFKIDPGTQLWHCFGCGEGGNAFTYLMKTEDLSFPEAVHALADRAHIEIAEEGGKRGPSRSQKARLKECCRETAAFYHVQLMRSGAERAANARSYLAGRGLGGSVPTTWNLGYAPGGGQLVRHLQAKGFTGQEMILANVAVEGRDGRPRDRFFDRVMFPIFDVTGDCIAFGGRIMGDGQPKYLNSQETPIFHKSQVLYGLNRAKGTMASTGTAIVVEGYTDVIALHEAGLGNAVATLGTALTMQHIRELGRHARKRIVYLFDGDAAGQRAADRALGFIGETMAPDRGRSGAELYAVTLPDDLDPADFVAQRGADALRALVDGATPLLQYGIERRLTAHDLSRPEGRNAAFADALSVLAPIKDSLIAKDYAMQIAGRTRMREEDALARLSQLRAPRRMPVDGAPAADAHARTAAANARMWDEGDRIPVAADPRAEREALLTRDPLPGYEQLVPAERNRRLLEREFLCLCVTHPACGTDSIDVLAQLAWHEPVHAEIASQLLDALEHTPGADAGSLVTRIGAHIPAAASILTGSTAVSSGDRTDAHALAAFLREELSLGDLEDTVAGLRTQMAAARENGGASDGDPLYALVVSIQQDINRRRSQLVPPVRAR